MSKISKNLVLFLIVATILSISACTSNPAPQQNALPAESPASTIETIPTPSDPEETPITPSLPPATPESTEEPTSSTPSEPSNIADPATTKLTANPTYLRRLFMNLGEIKAVLTDYNIEFTVSSKYIVYDDTAQYLFTAKDWKENDADQCYKIQAKLSELIPDMTESMELTTFIENLHSVAYDPSYEIFEDGAINRNAIASDRYVKIYFACPHVLDGGTSLGALLEIALPNDSDLIQPNANARISITAG